MDAFRRFAVVVGILAVLQSTVQGYQMFQDNIPNGKNVPHPCIPGEMWQGVGHENRVGGGVRNPFGVAFDLNGKVWNRTLCMADSDGDGMTNGQELGDPDCAWTKGSAVTLRTTDISHPGVCTPLNSDKCRGQSTFASCKSFECPAIDEAATFKYTVTIPETPVPAAETTYQCMPFEFPLDDEYHMVAFKPNIVNWNVMHHVVIYGCKDNADIKDSEINSTYNCFMGERDGCNDFLAVWALGIEGYCYIDVAGLRVGQQGYRRAIMELHWNNPQKVSTYTDSSGLDFYLTPNLRLNDAAVLMLGQDRLFIPPQEESFTVSGKCHSECTRQAMTGNVNIISVFNHMHNLGGAATSQLIVPGQSVDYIGYDETYDYNEPVSHVINPPLVVRPGDELEMICTFNSMGRNLTTEWGFGTYDEMCYAFITYYPAQNLQAAQCVSHGIFKECEPEGYPVANGCDFKNVFDSSLPEVFDRYVKIPELCSHFFCKKECKAYVKELYKDPCFNEENRRYSKEFLFRADESQIEIREFWSRVESCNMEIAREEVLASLPPGVGDGITDAASRDLMNALLVTCLMMVALLVK